MPAPRAQSNNRLNIRAKSRWEATTTIRFFIYCRWKGTDNLSWAEKIYETYFWNIIRLSSNNGLDDDER
jgi:hypothetical protein